MSLASKKLAAAVPALLATFGVQAAEVGHYYRYVGSEKVSTGQPGDDGPDKGANTVPGTGTLTVLSVTSVKARPGVPFNLAPQVRNPTGAVRWQSVGAPLPPGYTVSEATGAINGTTHDGAAGTYPGIKLMGTDTAGAQGTTQSISITVAPRPSVTMAGGTFAAGKPVSLAPSSSGSFGSVSWSLRGILPFGLQFDPNTGRITGSTRQAGTFPRLVATVTDAEGARGSSQPFDIVVTSDLVVGNLAPSYAARLGKTFGGVRPALAGASGAVEWTLASGTLPEGLSLSSTTGYVTGTPAALGTASDLVLQAREIASGKAVSSVRFSIKVADKPTIELAQSQYVVRVDGAPLDLRPIASGLAGPVRWSLAGGQLPDGLVLDVGTGTITGTARTATRLRALTLKAIDLADGSSAVSPPFELAVNDAIQIAAFADRVLQVGVPADLAPPTATGLIGEASWTLDGALPKGLFLDPATGAISGTPSDPTSDPVSLTYRVTDSADRSSAAGAPFALSALTVSQPTITAVKPSYAATAGRAFRIQPTLLGAMPPVIWQVSGLPGWASFDSVTGTLSGVPVTEGQAFPITLSAQDSRGAFAEPVSTSVTVGQARSLAYAAAAVGPGAPVTLDPVPYGLAADVRYALASGSLPNGLVLASESGRISGTIREPGTYLLSVQATDAKGTVASNVFSITVADAASSYSASIEARPGAIPGVAFAVAARASGFQGALTWDMAGTSLPAWAMLDRGTGTVSGTAPDLGVYGPFALRATDGAGNAARTNDFSLIVSAAPALSASVSGGTGVVGTPMSLSASSSNARGATSWSLSSGGLPEGLRLDETSGTISGVPLAAELASNLVLTVRDGFGGRADTAPFQIAIDDLPAIKAVPYAAAMEAVVGQMFSSQPLTVTNAADSYTVSVAEGSLPGWLGLDAASGALIGTPPSADSVGTLPPVILLVTDAKGRTARVAPIAITVKRKPLLVGSVASVVVRPGTAYTGTAPSAGNALGSVTWSVSPPLPAGLILDATSGIVSGTPTAPAGTTQHVLVARDGADGTTGSAALNVRLLSTPVVSSPSTTLARFNYASRVAFTATEVMPPLKWALAAGTLPSGMDVNADTGEIVGTPKAVGTSTGIRLRVTDAQGGVGLSDPFQIDVTSTIALRYPPVTWRLPHQRVTVPWASLEPIVDNGVAPLSFTLETGTLPPGITLSPATGILSGTPTAPFQGSVSLRVTDATGETAKGPALNVSMGAAPAIEIADIVVRAGAPLMVQPAISNAIPNEAGLYVTTLSGSLPDGLSLGLRFQTSDWVIQGTPKQVGTVSGLVLNVTDAQDAKGSSKPFSVTVEPGLSISGIGASYEGRVGRALGFALKPTVSNARGKVTWGYEPLPAGLTVNPETGELSGTPSASFNRPVTVTAVDNADGASARATFALKIAPALAVSGTADVLTHVGMGAVSLAPRVTGQVGTSLSWSSAGTALPSFASVDPGTGMVRLSVPTVGRTDGVKVGARDPHDGAEGASDPFSIIVLPMPVVADIVTNYSARIGFPFRTPAPSLTHAIGTVSWSLAGSLPTWAKSNPDGTVSGMPDGTEAVLGAQGLVLTGTDATGASAPSPAFSISVVSQLALSLVTSSQTGRLRVGDAYTLTPKAQGVNGLASWTLEYLGEPKLIDGLTLSDTGVISGTVTAPGDANFNLVVSDDSDGASTRSSLVTLAARDVLALAPMPGLVVRANKAYVTTPAPRPEGLAGTPLYELASQTLPQGFGPLDPVSGMAGGVPTQGQTTTNYTLKLTDSWDGRSATTSFAVTVLDELAFSTQPKSVAGVVGQPVSMTPVVANASGRKTFTLLKDGVPSPSALAECGPLALNAETGELSGSGTMVCTVQNLSLSVSDETGDSKISTTFGVVVTGPSVTLPVTSLLVQEGSEGQIQATTNLPTPTWSISGAPSGSTVDASGLVRIVGNEVTQDTDSTVTVSASANGRTATRTFALKVRAAAASVSIPAQVRSGKTLSGTVATTMTGAGTWSVTATGTPAFGNLAVTGTSLSGTAPAVTGSTPVAREIQVAYTASLGPSATRAVATAKATTTVYPPLAIAAPANQLFGIGSSVSFAPQSTGIVNTSGGTWTLYDQANASIGPTLGSVCPGLTFSQTTGTISGTPSGNCGLAGLTLSVYDPANAIASLQETVRSEPFRIDVAITGQAYILTANASTTFTFPKEGMKNVRILMMGGGASGGTLGYIPSNRVGYGTGGGSGYLTYVSLPVVNGKTMTYSVGRGGTSDIVGREQSGAPGGTSTLTIDGTTYTAAGGSGANGGNGGGIGTNGGAQYPGGIGGANGGGAGGTGQGTSSVPWTSFGTFKSAVVSNGWSSTRYGPGGTGHVGGCGGAGIVVNNALPASTPKGDTLGGWMANIDRPCYAGIGYGAGGASNGTPSSGQGYPATGGVQGVIVVEWDAQ